jgi:stage II sporulation protein D
MSYSSRWPRLLVLSAVACLTVTGPVLASGLTAPAPARASGGCFPAGGQAVPEAAAPATSGIIVRGHGWGHGLGMSQYGARGAALLGCHHAQILATYYAGTHLQRRTLTAPVLLGLRSGAARATVLAENRNLVWTTPAGTKRVQPAGRTWTVGVVNRNGRTGTGLLDHGGGLQMWITAGTLSAPHPGATVRVRSFSPGSSTASSDKRLRWGVLRFTRAGAGLTVEEMISSDGRGRSVDKYLWGLGEVPVSWPQEALRAQADAARTYLLRSFSGGAYRIGTTTASQVYAGAAREDEDLRYGSRWRTAVNATSGEVVVDALSAPIAAMYSSSDGGRSESRAYVYGDQGRYGYLTSVDDSRWDLASGNPHRSWAKAFTPQDFATALGFTSVSGVSLAAPGTAARQAGLQVTGVIGGVTRTVAFTGAAARSALGLRSSAFTVAWLPPAPVEPAALAGQPLTGDWDGDGRDEVGLFRSGQVSLRMADGTVTRYLLGRSGDIAVAGDWDGDGKDSVGVFRAGTWYLRNALSAGPFDRSFDFGVVGDQPVAGQWVGRGRQGIAVVRRGRWYLRRTATPGPADCIFTFGLPTDRALAGDWDGNGTDAPGLFRSGAFHLPTGLGTGPVRVLRLGRATDIPIIGNFDGVGGDTTGVFRVSTFYYRNDHRGGVATVTVNFAG